MKFLRLSLFAFCLLGVAMVHADDPAVKLREAIDASLDVVFDGKNADLSDAQKQTKIRGILESRYDLTVLIRRAMGRNWALLSGSEQTEVVELIKKLVLKAFIKNMSGIARPEITFAATHEITDKRVEVPSTVVLDGKTFYVLYRFGRLESGWEIYDIVAENVSVVSNYRQQLDDHFRKGTGAELIDKLEQLLQSDDLGNEIKI